MTSENRPIPVPPRDDPNRENLSALFDGELHGDAARFAMRRLDHDADWRDACGRWQLLGDVLRGQACAQAPAGFADRVEAALAAERATPAVAEEASRQPARLPRRWGRMGGAALAASVAVVAFLGLRPDLEQASPAPAPEARVTSVPDTTTAPPRAVASVPQVNAPTQTQAPAQPADQLGLAAAAVAVAELPRRARSQSTRSQAQRAGLRATRESQAPLQVARATAPAAATVVTDTGDGRAVAALSAAPAGDDALHPFLPPADEIRLRPWPRAEYPAGNGFTASYRTGSYPVTAPAMGARAGAMADGQARSFYPFEPRLPQQAELPSERPTPPPEGPRR